MDFRANIAFRRLTFNDSFGEIFAIDSISQTMNIVMAIEMPVISSIFMN